MVRHPRHILKKAKPSLAAADINPLDHYFQFGWHEGSDPSVNFDTKNYLAAYPDVAAENIDPLTHLSAVRHPRAALALR